MILKIHIARKEKKGYIIGRKVASNDNDPAYVKWEVEDALVKSWLINSMTDKLISHFFQYETTKEVWDVMRKRYLDAFDSSKVYELMNMYFQLC